MTSHPRTQTGARSARAFASSFSTSRRPESILRTEPQMRTFNESLAVGGSRAKPSGGRGVSWNCNGSTPDGLPASGDEDGPPLDYSGHKEFFDDSENAAKFGLAPNKSLSRTQGVFGSFEADADVDRVYHAKKRRSLLDRAVAAAASKSKNERRGDEPGGRDGGREDILDFDRRKGKRVERAKKRGSLVALVSAVGKAKSGQRDEDSDSKPRPKKRGSLLFVAHSIKYMGRKTPVDVGDDEAGRRRKPNRSRRNHNDASKQDDLTSSLVFFDKVASEKYSKRGSLLAEKSERRNRSDSSMRYARGGSKGSGRNEVRIKMGGEEGYDEKIASILYSEQ